MILIAVISLGAIGAVGAVFLYAASRNLKSTKILASHKYRSPSGANCGGCGYPGCAGSQALA